MVKVLESKKSNLISLNYNICDNNFATELDLKDRILSTVLGVRTRNKSIGNIVMNEDMSLSMLLNDSDDKHQEEVIVLDEST